MKFATNYLCISHANLKLPKEGTNEQNKISLNDVGHTHIYA